MIYTVFPKDDAYLPQDFSTYKEAEEYGNEEFGEAGYEIQSTDGRCV